MNKIKLCQLDVHLTKYYSQSVVVSSLEILSFCEECDGVWVCIHCIAVGCAVITSGVYFSWGYTFVV